MKTFFFAEHLSTTGEMQIKTTTSDTTSEVRTAIIKILQVTNTGERVKKKEPFYTVGGNVENSMEVSLKTKNRVTTRSSNLTPGHIFGEKHGLK